MLFIYHTGSYKIVGSMSSGKSVHVLLASSVIIHNTIYSPFQSWSSLATVSM